MSSIKNRSRVRTVTTCGILTALAMIFSYIETLVMLPVPVPGIKLGIANIAVITVLYIIGWKEAVAVNAIRITLTAVLFGNLNSFLFSMAGGILSMAVMIGLKRSGLFSVVGVSVAGGVVHNIGQIIAAVFLMESPAIAYYLPVLLAAGVITGIIIGAVGGLVTKRVAPVFRKMQ